MALVISENVIFSINKHYPNHIEYRNFTSFVDIDFDKKIIYTEKFDKKKIKYIKEEIYYEEASIMPANKANSLVKIASLQTYDNGWVKLRKPTFRSINDEDVYVIGDAQGEYPYPKSAQMANSCAFLVTQELSNRMKSKPFDYKHNMSGNVCYSMITGNKAVSITHSYKYTNKVNVSSSLSNINQQTALATKTWYEGLTNDIFGL